MVVQNAAMNPVFSIQSIAQDLELVLLKILFQFLFTTDHPEENACGRKIHIEKCIWLLPISE